jgi:hypothetical protein
LGGGHVADGTVGDGDQVRVAVRQA